MRFITRVGASCLLATGALLAASACASAAPKRITGKLSKPGYTVIALAADGGANTVLALSGAFGLVPPAETVTLHLRAHDGTYAGPVVLEPKKNFELADAKRKVRRAKAKLRKAKRRVAAAKRDLAAAERKLEKASGKKDRQRAKRDLEIALKDLKSVRERLRRAKQRLRKANRALRRAEREDADRPNRATLGVKAGTQLGEVAVNPTAGYAKVGGIERASWEAFVDTTLTARATDGVPIGAGNFGRVSVSELNGPGSDLDLDGVPAPLDIDDDGDLILDALDRSSGALAAQAPAGSTHLPIGTGLTLPLHDLVNADLVDSSGERVFEDPEIEAALPTFGVLGVEVLPGDNAELDCGGSPNPAPPPAWLGGRPYCTLGGTGRDVINFNPPEGTPFPACCDSDGDGFGSFNETMGRGLLHGATTAEIAAGNQLTEWVTTGGAAIPCPPPDGTLSDFCTPYVGVVQFVFATVPAVVSYSDNDVPPHAGTISYPVTQGTTFPVGAPPGQQDLVLELTFVPPQRRPTSRTECVQQEDPMCTQKEWIDMGGLRYEAEVSGLATMGLSCPQEDFESTSSRLVPAPPKGPGSTEGGLLDDPGDRPASPQNTLSFKLNVTDCREKGQGAPLSSGDEFNVILRARPSSLGGLAETGVTFKLVD